MSGVVANIPFGRNLYVALKAVTKLLKKRISGGIIEPNVVIGLAQAGDSHASM